MVVQVQRTTKAQRTIEAEVAVHIETAFAVIVDGAVIRREVVLDHQTHEHRIATKDVDGGTLIIALGFGALAIAGGGTTFDGQAIQERVRIAVDRTDHVVGVVVAIRKARRVIAQQIAIEHDHIQLGIALGARRFVAAEATVDGHAGHQAESGFALLAGAIRAARDPDLVAGLRLRQNGG